MIIAELPPLPPDAAAAITNRIPCVWNCFAEAAAAQQQE
jgi:hypothetical protein